MSVDYKLLASYINFYPHKALRDIEQLKASEIAEVFQGLSSQTIVFALNKLNYKTAGQALISLSDSKFCKVFSLLDPIRAARILYDVDELEKSKKLHLLTQAERDDLESIAQYPTDSAGSIMDTSLVTARDNDTVSETIKMLRHNKAKSREIFIVDLDNKLRGHLLVQDLLYAKDNELISDVMNHSPPAVNALAPKSEAIEAFETFKTTQLPITHIDGTLIGAIRYTTLVGAVQDEAISKIAAIGGADPSEKVLSGPFQSVKKRLPWLLINLLTAFIASAVVGVFEGTIAKVTALAILLPVVAGQSGNTGAQAMAVAMRGLALREVRIRQWAKILFKELRVGFINGIAIALTTGGAVYFWNGSVALALIMIAAMTLSMIIASISGAAIPVILTALNKDPAQSSSVILTTVTDVMGFLSFLGLATLFISLLV